MQMPMLRCSLASTAAAPAAAPAPFSSVAPAPPRLPLARAAPPPPPRPAAPARSTSRSSTCCCCCTTTTTNTATASTPLLRCNTLRSAPVRTSTSVRSNHHSTTQGLRLFCHQAHAPGRCRDGLDPLQPPAPGAGAPAPEAAAAAAVQPQPLTPSTAAFPPGGGRDGRAAAAAWRAPLGAAAAAALSAGRSALLGAAGCTACAAAAVLLALHLSAPGPAAAAAAVESSTPISGYAVAPPRSAPVYGSGSRSDPADLDLHPYTTGSDLRSGWGPGSGSGSGSWRGDVASEVEDKLLELVRQVETRVGSAVGSVTHILEAAEPSADADAAARALIAEVWEVVDQNFLDARGSGFDRAAWAALRDAALAPGRHYGSTAAGYRAVREMLAWGVADPYCRFVPPDELAAMKKYDVTGVGLNLGTAEEYVRKTGRPLPSAGSQAGGVYVVGISKSSAADLTGIQQGDEVVEVDGRDVSMMSPFQASSLIQGVQQEQGKQQQQQQQPSLVGIQVRKSDGSVVTKFVPRPTRDLASPLDSRLVKAGMLRPETTGLMRLSSFNARAHRDLAGAIDQLEAAGAKALVLDLRDNRGGLVSEGLEVARLFLDPGSPIVITESRVSGPAPDGGAAAAAAAAAPLPSFNTVPMASGAPRTALPLTLLVNEHTASAAEIVAGALKDNCRAVLVGNQTYGKGLIQSVYELSDGSGAVVTVGRYLTPSHIDIDRNGIRPNFSAQPTGEEMAQALNACRLSKEHDVLLELAAAELQQRQGP